MKYLNYVNFVYPIYKLTVLFIGCHLNIRHWMMYLSYIIFLHMYLSYFNMLTLFVVNCFMVIKQLLFLVFTMTEVLEN